MNLTRVRGFHGTTSSKQASILTEGFELSRNPYDWLGDGIYFFQDAPRRAWQWATEHHGPEAAVLGASIRVEDFMDLLDVGWAREITAFYDAFVAHLKAAGRPLPVQQGGAHRLDRQVLNYAVGVLEQRGLIVRAVRAPFVEGSRIFPNSGLFDQAHVQIAVRDPSIIEDVWVEPESSTSGRF